MGRGRRRRLVRVAEIFHDGRVSPDLLLLLKTLLRMGVAMMAATVVSYVHGRTAFSAMFVLMIRLVWPSGQPLCNWTVSVVSMVSYKKDSHDMDLS